MPQFDPNYPVIDEELRALVPPLTKEERELLESSMLTEGQSDSIVLWERDNVVLDGHHRLEICREHKMPVEARFLCFETKAEAMVWMIDNQRGRRNLTTQQKLALGRERARLLEPLAKENLRRSPAAGFQGSEKLPKPINITKEMAAYAGVSTDTASKYKVVMDRGNEEIKKRLNAGEITVTAAYNQATGKTPKPKPKLPKATDSDYGTRPNCSVSDAKSFAYMAITNLRQIRDDDPERQEALDSVVEWINEHREKGD